MPTKVYINGKQVGYTTYMSRHVVMSYLPEVLKAGTDLIAVRVTSTNGKTGLLPDKPYWLGTDANPLPLSGEWKVANRIG